MDIAGIVTLSELALADATKLKHIADQIPNGSARIDHLVSSILVSLEKIPSLVQESRSKVQKSNLRDSLQIVTVDLCNIVSKYQKIYASHSAFGRVSGRISAWKTRDEIENEVIRVDQEVSRCFDSILPHEDDDSDDSTGSDEMDHSSNAKPSGSRISNELFYCIQPFLDRLDRALQNRVDRVDSQPSYTRKILNLEDITCEEENTLLQKVSANLVHAPPSSVEFQYLTRMAHVLSNAAPSPSFRSKPDDTRRISYSFTAATENTYGTATVDALSIMCQLRRITKDHPEDGTLDLLFHLSHSLTKMGLYNTASELLDHLGHIYDRRSNESSDNPNDEAKLRLALILADRAECFRGTDQYSEAESFIRVAITMYSDLIRNRSEYRPSVASALFQCALTLRNMGYHDKAVKTYSEALSVQRLLSYISPDLPRSLLQVSQYLTSLNRDEDALMVAREADYTSHLLIHQDPFSKGLLLRSLHILGRCLSALGRHEEALTVAHEEISQQRLVSADVPTLGLAASLMTKVAYQERSKQSKIAFELVEEAAGILRRLRNEGEPMSASFASTLSKVAGFFWIAQRFEEGFEFAQEAVAGYRELSLQRPQQPTEEYALTLRMASYWFMHINRHEDAMHAILESADTLRAIRQIPPPIRGRMLSGVLLQASYLFEHKGAHDEALAAAQESADILNAFAAEDSQNFNPELALCLQHLARCFHAKGMTDEALQADQRSAACYRATAKASPKDFDQGHASPALSGLGGGVMESSSIFNALCDDVASLQLHEKAALPQMQLEAGERMVIAS